MHASARKMCCWIWAGCYTTGFVVRRILEREKGKSIFEGKGLIAWDPEVLPTRKDEDPKWNSKK
jgi:hypothetical protein